MTEDIKQQLYDSIVNGKQDQAVRATETGLNEGIGAPVLLNEVMIPALQKVGELFQTGEYFVPDMLLSAKAMKAGLALLRPHLAKTDVKPVGTYLLLTVKGDIHDIGKDLVKVMLEGVGFNVIDMGVNVPPDKIVKAIEEHKPEIVGFSAFLTTTMPMFKDNIETIKKSGVRDQVKVMVGGAPVTEEYARFVGADGFAPNANVATRIALDLIQNGESSQYLLRDKGSSTKTYSKIAGSGVDLFKKQRRFPARAEMKPIERVLAVLKHQMPDRVPHFEWVFDDSVVRRVSGGKKFPDMVDQLDIDAVVVSPFYRKENIGDGLLRDEWGAIRTVGKEEYAMPIDERAPVQSFADIEKWVVPDPYAPERLKAIREAVQRWGGHRAIILQGRDVWSGPRDYMGYMRLLTSVVEEPELVDAVTARVVDHYIAIIQQAAEIGVQIVFSGDDVADNRGPLFAPKIWHELFMPHYRRLVNAIHACGLYHWKHSDGNMYPLLDSIVEAGSDGIDPIDPLGGMELSVVKAKYGSRVAIKGNVDQTELLMYGPPEKVVEAVKTCIRDAGAGGGYVCSSSNSIHSGVDPEMYQVMVDAIHYYGRYPLDMELLQPEFVIADAVPA